MVSAPATSSRRPRFNYAELRGAKLGDVTEAIQILQPELASAEVEKQAELFLLNAWHLSAGETATRRISVPRAARVIGFSLAGGAALLGFGYGAQDLVAGHVGSGLAKIGGGFVVSVLGWLIESDGQAWLDAGKKITRQQVDVTEGFIPNPGSRGHQSTYLRTIEKVNALMVNARLKRDLAPA